MSFGTGMVSGGSAVVQSFSLAVLTSRFEAVYAHSIRGRCWSTFKLSVFYDAAGTTGVLDVGLAAFRVRPTAELLATLDPTVDDRRFFARFRVAPPGINVVPFRGGGASYLSIPLPMLDETVGFLAVVGVSLVEMSGWFSVDSVPRSAVDE